VLHCARPLGVAPSYRQGFYDYASSEIGLESAEEPFGDLERNRAGFELPLAGPSYLRESELLVYCDKAFRPRSGDAITVL
jgi:hypothetical protein